MNEMRRACGACGGTELAVFLDLGKTPLANTFPATAHEPQNFYPLQVGRCGNCGLVQGMEVIDDRLIFGADYGFYSGASQAQRDYHKAGADLLLKRHWHQARQFTVEIACNDGSMLRHFALAGATVLGVDPSAPAQVAIDQGLPVMRDAFTAEMAQRIRDEYGQAGLVIAYNSMAHVGDLADVLTGIWTLLDPSGVAVIEVQYLPDLLVGNMYDQVYHEHRYFYSLTSLKRAAALHGLHVLDAELIELQGGGLRVTLASRHLGESNRARRILASERWLTDDAYAGVQGRVDRARDHMVELLNQELTRGRVVCGYTAAAKATTILNYAGITAASIPYVMDTTAYKQGRYVPGVKIPIIDPEDVAFAVDDAYPVADTRLLLAPNYLGHLLRSSAPFFERGGRWLVPTPTPVLI